MGNLNPSLLQVQLAGMVGVMKLLMKILHRARIPSRNLCKLGAIKPSSKRCGVRTIHLRTGIVLDATGGALGKMLLPAKLGGGGPIGRVAVV